MRERFLGIIQRKLQDFWPVPKKYVPSVQKAPDQPSEPIRSINDYNFIRRRQRAARKSITSGIDYRELAKSLSSRLPD